MNMGHAELIWRVYVDAVHRDGVEGVDGLQNSRFWLDDRDKSG